MFRKTWCEVDFATVELMAKGVEYERPHTLLGPAVRARFRELRALFGERADGRANNAGALHQRPQRGTVVTFREEDERQARGAATGLIGLYLSTALPDNIELGDAILATGAGAIPGALVGSWLSSQKAGQAARSAVPISPRIVAFSKTKYDTERNANRRNVAPRPPR